MNSLRIGFILVLWALTPKAGADSQKAHVIYAPGLDYPPTARVSIHRSFSKCSDKLTLDRDERVVIRDRVCGELEDELILHRGFGSNETEISCGGRESTSPAVKAF
jgi:hypothetical protein